MNELRHTSNTTLQDQDNSNSTERHTENFGNSGIYSTELNSIDESIDTENNTVIERSSNSDNITLENIEQRENIAEENSFNNCLYCVNCKRWNTFYPHENNEYKLLYEVQTKQVIIKKTSLRRKFSRMKLSCFEHGMLHYSSDSIKVNLCEHCTCYFTVIEHTDESLQRSCWPSIFWRYLSSKDLYKRHGYYIWRIIPLQWQKWWEKSLEMFLSPRNMYENASLSDLDPCIIDVTERYNDLEKSLIDGELGSLMRSCDNNLLPLVKCPWGCTEYYHMTGKLSIETIFARFVADSETEKFMSYTARLHAIAITAGCRNDYLCVDSSFKLSCLLENPIWKIGPSVCFKNGIPMFLTCRTHNNGSNKFYLHPPKNPFGSLPSNISDQISPAVVVPRTIKATKANKYSHSFNMQEMRCQFNGIDTLSITDKAIFINKRDDIKSYVSNLSKSNKNVASNLSESLLNRASDIIENNNYVNTFKSGGSFVTVKDAIELQYQMKTGQTRVIERIFQNQNIQQFHYTPKWPMSIYYIHTEDSYGASFFAVSKPSMQHDIDTRIVWFLQNLHVCCQEIWKECALCVKSAKEWYGWILLYSTEMCFPHLLKTHTRQKDFSWYDNRSKYDKERKLFQVMKILKQENQVFNITNYETIDERNNNSNDNISQSTTDSFDTSAVFSVSVNNNLSNVNNTQRNLNYIDTEIEFDTSIDVNRNINIEMELDTGINVNGNISIDNLPIDTNNNDSNIDLSNYVRFDVSYYKYLFNECKNILVVDNTMDWVTSSNNSNANVLIYLNSRGIQHNNNTTYNFIPLDLANNNTWDLRNIYFTKNSTSADNINKWTASIFCRHSGNNFKYWWHLSSEKPVYCKMDKMFDIWNVDENTHGNCILAVFVKTNIHDIYSYRNLFLKTIGGQSTFICKMHNVPLVVSLADCQLVCCYTENETISQNNVCKKKYIYASCPIQFCTTCICRDHYNGIGNDVNHYIALTPLQNTNDTNTTLSYLCNNTYTNEKDENDDDYITEPIFGNEYDCESSQCDNSTEYNDTSSISNCYDVEHTGGNDESMEDESIVSNKTENMENDNIVHYNLDLPSHETDILNQNNYCIPCSPAGAGGGMYLSEETKETFVGCHVILNNCGMLLARRGHKLKGSKIQQRFLQCIVARNVSKSVPLLYPEALLFPSIFWKQNDVDLAPLGAIPCCLLAHDSTLNNNGFASLINHFRSRITNSDLLTSTDPRYISFCFDQFLNLQTRHTHTRLILNRGLWNVGLGRSLFTTKESMYDVESIENRPVVNKLAAAVAENQATYFYTHTCNQEDHFGIRNIKKWIDSYELESIIISKINAIKGLTENIERYRDELKKSIIQSSAVIMLRNWMEVSTIWMDYIKTSKERPLGKVKQIWWRHEYQDTKGNLSHIHALIWNESEPIEETLNRIRGSTIDLISNEELDVLLEEQVIKGSLDLQRIKELAMRFLRHVCNDRCKKRTGPDKKDIKCRVTNNGVENPTPNYHQFKEFEVQYSQNCIEILMELGLMEYNDIKQTYIMHDKLKAIKHFPPAIGGEGNISACNGKLFAACLSNNNLKYVTSYLASRYLAKYVASVDENNRVYLCSNENNPYEIKGKMEFLYNTKISGSAINEKIKKKNFKYRNKPQGRAISLMEVVATLLGYPQVNTNIKFIHIPTTPLAERAAVTKYSDYSKQNYLSNCNDIDDFDAKDIVPQYYIRNIKLKYDLPLWRQYTDYETLLLKDQMFSNLSIDNVTYFGMRPPELRFVRSIKLYFKWFSFKKLKCKNTFSDQVSFLDNVININVHKTMWIDGAGRKVVLRINAINEIIQYLNSRKECDFYGMGQTIDTNTTIKLNLLELLLFIKSFITSVEVTNTNNIEEKYRIIAEYYLDISTITMLRKELQNLLPTIWYSSIKPSNGNRWLLHLMISMGEFENEYSLYCQHGIKECFIACKLLSSNSTNYDEEIKVLAKRYILEQLNYIPGGSKQFDRNVIATYQTLKNLLLIDTPNAMELPPVLYTQLQHSIDMDCKNYLKNMKKRLIDTTINKIEKKCSIVLPNKNDLLTATKLDFLRWHPIIYISCGTTQGIESFCEQKSILQYGCDLLQIFLSGSVSWNQNMIICGGPGVGKTTILQILIIYAASIGLNVNLTSVMSERSIELGGIHLSKLFCIPTERNKSPSLISEKAVLNLLKNPKQLAMLQKLEVLAIDEFGQVSAELLSVLDIILRTIRNNSLFMGGVLIIATMDNMQLPPVHGRPPLLSPHMLSSFTFKVLDYSVRASCDINLQEIQKITRMSYNELQANDISRFQFLIQNCCTFVNDFNDPIITTEKLRIFGKRSAKVLAEEKLLTAQRHRHGNDLIECIAIDFETTLESQWIDATPTTTRLLSQKVKEPYKLCFYPNAVYEITYNNGDNFSQGQIAILAKMPTITEISKFSPVSIYVAPNGCKTVPSNINFEILKQQGWSLQQIGKCPEHPEYLNSKLVAKRKQYGLRHRIASTIHAAMGQDLEYIVTKVTDTSGDPNYNLWDKEQVVVLLSRTNYAKNIIFVGDKVKTSKALSDLLTKRSQYTEYMSLMLSKLCCRSVNSNISTFNLNLYPFRTIDFEIPVNSSGFVYLIQSRNAQMNFPTYIGETQNIVRRLRDHNQLRGSKSTRNPLLLPWALIAFVTGFETNSKAIRRNVEKQWKIERNKLTKKNRCPLSIKETCNIAKNLVNTNSKNNLRLIICCNIE